MTEMTREQVVAFAGEQLVSSIDELVSMKIRGEDLLSVEMTHTIVVKGEPFTIHIHHGHCEHADPPAPVTLQ